MSLWSKSWTSSVSTTNWRQLAHWIFSHVSTFRLSLLTSDCQNDQQNFQGQVWFLKCSLTLRELFLLARNFMLHERTRVAPFRPVEDTRATADFLVFSNTYFTHQMISVAAWLIFFRDLGKSYRTFITPVIVKLRCSTNNSWRLAIRRENIKSPRFRGLRKWNHLARQSGSNTYLMSLDYMCKARDNYNIN